MSSPSEYDRVRHAFTAALERCQQLPGLYSPAGAMPGPEHVLIERVHAAVIEALIWARGFDDAARGKEDPVVKALPGYDVQRPQWMDAARYAANKGVHLLMRLTDVHHLPGPPVYGMSPFAGGTFSPLVTWSDKPPAVHRTANGNLSSEDRRLRAAFVQHWSGQPVWPTLTAVQTVLAFGS